MGRPTSILVVEDEALTAMCLREELTRMGFHVARCVSTGEEAVVAARETAPDLILMDIRLAGDMDGIDAARLIQQQANIPIVFMTGYADQGHRARAMALAPLAYYVKPVNAAELACAIGSVRDLKTSQERANER